MLVIRYLLYSLKKPVQLSYTAAAFGLTSCVKTCTEKDTCITYRKSRYLAIKKIQQQHNLHSS